MKHFVLFSLFSVFAVSALAQEENIIVHTSQGTDQIIEIPESLQSDTDSLYNNWMFKNLLSAPIDCTPLDVNPEVSDSLLMERLAQIPSLIEMPFNEITKEFIERYASKLRKKISYSLAASNFYMPIFEEALDLYDLPIELKYLPIIESALNPSAVSRQGATGLWQFMLRTGQFYGLTVNSFIDERRDPVKATWAAAKLLKSLYGIYNDWNLVLAAFNCGPGNVNKAIKRADGKTDYWEIYSYLPRETQGYVPSFIATTYLMNYYCEHGICPMETQLPSESDTIMVNKDLHFKQIAGVCDISLEEIKTLNPQYKRDIIPGNSGSYPLRLPSNIALEFLSKEDSIYNFKVANYTPRRQNIEISKETAVNSSTQTKYYKVRKGDTYSSIAKRFNTTVARIRQLNGHKGKNLIAGKSIRVR